MNDQSPIHEPQALTEQVERLKSRGYIPPATPSSNPVTAPQDDSSTGLAALPAAIAWMKELQPARTDDEIRVWEWQNTILENLKDSQLPSRFHYEVEQWEPKQRAKFDECRGLLQRKGAIIALIGDRGVGKTTVAAQLIIERAWNPGLQPWERRPPYRKLTDLIATYKLLYSDHGGINTEALMAKREWFCRFHPFVVIDELHDCDDQRLKGRVLTDLLDRRYSHQTDTLLISNQSVDEFKETTSSSVLSRLKEHGRILVCKWNSFR